MTGGFFKTGEAWPELNNARPKFEKLGAGACSCGEFILLTMSSYRALLPTGSDNATKIFFQI